VLHGTLHAGHARRQRVELTVDCSEREGEDRLRREREERAWALEGAQAPPSSLHL
jgi:hypothetical protein